MLCLLAYVLIYSQSIHAEQSSIQSFNEKFPPSNEVVIALEQIRSIIPSHENSIKQFEKRYAKNLELRAFACSHFYSSKEDKPEKTNDLESKLKKCLARQDEQLLELIGVSVVGYRFMQPPLRPLARLGSASFIPNRGSMRFFGGTVSSKSNVAVLINDTGEIVSVEVPSGKVIADLSTKQTAGIEGIRLSPNGRLTVVNGEFIDNESGIPLWRPQYISIFYAWLPEVKAALISRRVLSDTELLILDFETGKIHPYNIPYKNQTWALNISESRSKILLGFGRDIAEVENIRTKTSVIGRVVKDYQLNNGNITYGIPTLMQNGKSIFFQSNSASGNYPLMLFNFRTGEETVFDAGVNQGQFLDKVNYAKVSENELLFISEDLATGIPNTLVFNVKDQTLSPIESEEVWGRPSGSEGRIGYIRRAHNWGGEPIGVWIGEELKKTGSSEPLASAVNLRRLGLELNELEKELYYKYEKRDSYQGYETQIAEKRAQMLGDIPSNTQVKAIGIIQAKDTLPATNGFRNLTITINKTKKPLVLMLTSYNRLRWNIKKETGANLIAVIVSSYEGSEVTGAGKSKTIVRKIVGRNDYFAYEQNSPAYKILNDETILWTGKPISKFQGKYEGESFIVGD